MGKTTLQDAIARNERLIMLYEAYSHCIGRTLGVQDLRFVEGYIREAVASVSDDPRVQTKSLKIGLAEAHTIMRQFPTAYAELLSELKARKIWRPQDFPIDGRRMVKNILRRGKIKDGVEYEILSDYLADTSQAVVEEKNQVRLNDILRRFERGD